MAAEGLKGLRQRGISAIGEGPIAVRTLSFAGGVALIVLSFWNILNILGIVFDPAAYLLNFCLIVLGACLVGIESKQLSTHCQSFFNEWCKILTIPLGKGFFSIFIGLLLLSQATIPISPTFIIGGYMLAIGILYLLVQPRNRCKPGLLSEEGEDLELNEPLSPT